MVGLGRPRSARSIARTTIENPRGLSTDDVTIGAGADGLCLRRSSHFVGFVTEGWGVEGCAKAQGMRLILMAHFAILVGKRLRHRVHSLVVDDIVRAKGNLSRTAGVSIVMAVASFSFWRRASRRKT